MGLQTRQLHPLLMKDFLNCLHLLVTNRFHPFFADHSCRISFPNKAIYKVKLDIVRHQPRPLNRWLKLKQFWVIQNWTFKQGDQSRIMFFYLMTFIEAFISIREKAACDLIKIDLNKAFNSVG